MDDLIKEFETKVIEEFSFLETRYPYSRHPLQVRNNKAPDGEAKIVYGGRTLSVEIIWYFDSAYVGVNFVEHLGDQYPDKISFFGHDGFGRVISLYSLMSFKKVDLSEAFLANVRSVKFTDIKRRNEAIKNNMKGVVDNLSYSGPRKLDKREGPFKVRSCVEVKSGTSLG